MTQQEEIFFAALTKDREEIADVLERRAVRGYKESVVEKYSDQAHFVYELLQNADDVGATRARFKLERNQLFFAHNGTRHFSVSDPKNEEKDSQNGALGDINSITSIANSNKTTASIGKFGVGFKAVFQYTETPLIYDPNFSFQIERFIVPIMLKNDCSERKPEETLFIFPFNHLEHTAQEAYADISGKLRGLTYPLLFLSNLMTIEYEFENTTGMYAKNIVERLYFENTIAEKIELIQKSGNDIWKQTLWVFSRVYEGKNRYSVGFFLTVDGKLHPVTEYAFCFFPTREVTNLNFIIHAPFLLTDSREGIRAGVAHNEKMVRLLANLAADSLEYLKEIGEKNSIRLIDDTIVDLIPTKHYTNDEYNNRKISFLPFYYSILKKFTECALIPSKNGYVMKQNAYWAASPRLTNIISDEQLVDITDNKDAHWAFTSLGRDDVQNNNKILFVYIESLVRTNLSEENVINGRNRDFYYDRALGQRVSLENIKGITPEFIEKQPIAWLFEFYQWLSETKHRTEVILKKPVFLDQRRKAVAAYDKNGQHILFLPIEGMDNYEFVNSELLANYETRLFVQSIGVTEPSLKDRIYNNILPQYAKNYVADSDSDFLSIFEYYCKCSNEDVSEYISLLKNCSFLKYYAGGRACYGVASSMYLPTEELLMFFEGYEEVHFVALDEYTSLVEIQRKAKLVDFLKDLGIKSEVTFETREIDHATSNRTDLPNPVSTRKITWTEPVLEGCIELLHSIEKDQEVRKSVLLWNVLLHIIKKECTKMKTAKQLFWGKCSYFFRTRQNEAFESSDLIALKSTKWICDVNGMFHFPREVQKKDLADIYNVNVDEAEQLLDLLEIGYLCVEDDSNLTDSQREKIALADKLKSFGIETEEDLAEFQEYKRRKNEKKKSANSKESNARKSYVEKENDNDAEELMDEIVDEIIGYEETQPEKVNPQTYTSSVKKKVLKDIVQYEKTYTNFSKNLRIEEEEEADEDEWMPSIVDYQKKIETAKKKSASEIERISFIEELQDKALSFPKYSYGWFSTILDMECANSNENNSQSREVSISFGRVEREPDTKRTLVLKYPNRYIPQFMEDLTEIPLVLHIGDQTRTVAIEVANIKSYTLRVMLKNAEAIDDLDLKEVALATIDAQSPTFLIDELRKQFAELRLENDYNMQEHLCENIEFIFGPPGTGKTTYLAKNVLLPLMKNNTECKVLVLTPTNKAADVLVKRIMDVAGEDTSYEEWLVRFGATGDEKIEQSPIFREKTFDIRTLSKNVTVTTIARFPYDFFMPQNVRLFLYSLNWDYIVIDEASMIPLINIIFPLYKKTPKKFIIAGDPFQIEPITSVDLWKNENIYTMVNLQSFSNPTTVPYQYKVELLKTQYRSVPAIGEIFSKFAYDGILSHYRSAESRRRIMIEADKELSTLNIIKFPVSKYESIYRCKRLRHSSSYQVYSAVFTFEYVCYLSRKIAKNNNGELVRIGVVAPYRAQADIIEKLIASEKLPSSVDVQVGTIHGFQGDECDIVFAVFNTPPFISASREMFLNKRNIINVSISRARDYLFVVMPNDDTENIDNLFLVNKVEKLIKQNDEWNEELSSNLELEMFDDSTYIENNSFSTSHQSVNVYGLPEKMYEVRTEDDAVDVQIHKGK